MGVGVSSLRLRKTLVIRAYNLRDEDETLDEQFRKLCFYTNQEESCSGGGSGDGRDSISEGGSGKGELTLNLDDVKEYLGFGKGSSSATFDRLLGGTLQGQRIPFKAFVDFLETGSTPSMELPIPDPTAIDDYLNSDGTPISSDVNSVNNSSQASNKGTLKSGASASASSCNSKVLGSKLRAKFPASRSGTSSTKPPSPPRDVGGSPISLGSGSGASAATDSTQASKKGVSSAASAKGRTAAALAFARTAADADYTEVEEPEADGADSGEVEEDASDDKNENACLAGPELCSSPLSRQASSLDLILSKNAESLSRNSSGNVWQKREVVTQERTVHYTTIDDDGVLQELIEKETSQTEVLHMESRDTGVFAHRETTLYDQTETFNSQVVGETHGVEEYVHMRSEDDEYEYMDSNMPEGKGRNGGEQEPQISPRAQQQQQHGERNSNNQGEYDYDGDGGSYASPQFSPYQTENGIDPSKMHDEDEEHVHMPGRGKPPRFDLHLNLDPLSQANAQSSAEGAAPADSEAGQGFNPNLDTSNMDDETKAYYVYLQATQEYSAEQIRLAEDEIAAKQGTDDMGVRRSPSPGLVRMGGGNADGFVDGDYFKQDSTEQSPEENSMDQRRREKAARQRQHAAVFTSASAGDDDASGNNDEDHEEFVGVGAAADAALRELRSATAEAEDEAMYDTQRAAQEATAAALKMFAEAQAAQTAAGAGMNLGFSQEIEVEEEGENHIAFINVPKGHISDID